MKQTQTKSKEKSSQAFKKLLKLISGYRLLLLLSILLAAGTVILQLYVPILFGNAMILTRRLKKSG